MTTSKVIGGQIVIVILVKLFSNFVRTGSLQLQPNLDHRNTKVHNGNLYVMMLFEVT